MSRWLAHAACLLPTASAVLFLASDATAVAAPPNSAVMNQGPWVNPLLSRALRGFGAPDNDFEEAADDSGADGPPLELRLFSEAQAEAFGARNLDGSPSGYYYRAGVERDSFVISLQGGGLCTSASDCKKRALGDLGSSTHWTQTWPEGATGLLCSNTSFNPFGNWTHIFVPYGSGDVYVGRQRQRNPIGLYFAGHNTLEAVVSDLKNRSGLSSARRVLFSGRSAGGIGTFQNADWLGEQLDRRVNYKATPQCGGFFPNAMLKVMPQYASGILNGSKAGGDPELDAVALMADYVVDWFGGTEGPEAIHMDQSCLAAMPLLKKHTCWSAAVHYPHIATPLLVAQNRFDKMQAGQIMGEEWWPYPNNTKQSHAQAQAAYLRYFGRKTVSGLAAAVMHGPKNHTDALFMPSCLEHGLNLCMRTGSVVHGLRYNEVLADWFSGRNKLPHLLLDDCNARLGTDDPCNSMCTCPP